MLLEGKRVFIVEDNAGNNAVMQMLLESQGAKVNFERWGTGAVERLQAFAPVDIILMDLMLPRGITGYDVFDQIRQLPEFDAIPIVAVSAADASTAIPKTQAKGFSGYIAKPIDYDLFPRQILQLLNHEPVWYSARG